jgi:hypothetical protein
VQPHIPYLKARAQALTAPYSSRASAFHQSYISPRLATAQSYAKNASDRTAKTYTYVSTHPLTGTTQKFLNAFYQVARRRGYDAYVWSRPHLIRAGQLAETIAKEFLGPHAVRALQWGADQAVRGWVVLKL